MILLLAAGLITGTVTSITDGDTFRMGETRIRLQAIDANELHGGCHTTCAPQSAAAARDNLAKIALGRPVACEVSRRSYRRLVAFCSVDSADLSCAQWRGGYGVKWDRYDRDGGLERRCPR